MRNGDYGSCEKTGIVASLPVNDSEFRVLFFYAQNYRCDDNIARLCFKTRKQFEAVKASLIRKGLIVKGRLGWYELDVETAKAATV